MGYLFTSNFLVKKNDLLNEDHFISFYTSIIFYGIVIIKLPCTATLELTACAPWV